jgi:hypothetical protein
MYVKMRRELWEAVIVAIDCDLNEFSSMGVGDDPHLYIRYGKMFQARGIIREAQLKAKENEYEAN